MSAQDEVSVVVKCLRLGAADYLVKPLRTNELLNLWTHMWRRRRMVSRANLVTRFFNIITHLLLEMLLYIPMFRVSQSHCNIGKSLVLCLKRIILGIWDDTK